VFHTISFLNYEFVFLLFVGVGVSGSKITAVVPGGFLQISGNQHKESMQVHGKTCTLFHFNCTVFINI